VSWLAAAVLETAIASMPPALVGPSSLERANARVESATWLALVIGPAVGAPLVAWLGVDSVFVLDAVTSIVAIALVAPIRLPARTQQSTVDDSSDGQRSAWRETVSGLRYAATHRPVRTALYLGALPGLAFGMFVALEPLFYRDVVGTQVEALGYVNAVFGLGLLLGSVIVARAGGRLSTFRTVILLTMASGLGGMVYVATPSLSIVLVGAVLWSVPLGTVLPLMRTLAQRRADPAFVGRVMGAFGTAMAAASLLPVVVAPTLAAAFGVQTVLAASAATAVIGAPFVWRAGRELDREQHRNDDRPPRQGSRPDLGPSVDLDTDSRAA
jgi:predicted MFS family arabinose efflux permease